VISSPKTCLKVRQQEDIPFLYSLFTVLHKSYKEGAKNVHNNFTYQNPYSVGVLFFRTIFIN